MKQEPESYKPLTAIFAIQACGLTARIALENTGSEGVRLDRSPQRYCAGGGISSGFCLFNALADGPVNPGGNVVFGVAQAAKARIDAATAADLIGVMVGATQSEFAIVRRGRFRHPPPNHCRRN